MLVCSNLDRWRCTISGELVRAVFVCWSTFHLCNSDKTLTVYLGSGSVCVAQQILNKTSCVDATVEAKFTILQE